MPLRAGGRYVLRVDGKGRVTIPLPLRESLGIEPGTVVELTVDASGRAVVVRPATSGVVASYRVSLYERRNVVSAVSAVLEEGSDLRLVECWESECVIEAFVIDEVMVERIAERLRAAGVEVVEYTSK